MKIGIIGRADHDNFGDSLMFAFYIKEMNQLEISPYLINASDVFLKRILELGLTCGNIDDANIDILDRAFFIGGGYFGEPDIGAKQWNINFINDGYFKKTSQALIDKNIPYDVLGVEVGPLSNKYSRKIVKEILRNSENVYLRNHASIKFTRQHLGLKPEMLRDVVLGETKQFSKNLGISIEKENKLIVHCTGKILKDNFLSEILRKKIIEYICLKL
jgi:hypothetical protein